MFTDLVNITDEALVMQIVKLYFPRWDKGEDLGDEDDSEETNEMGSKHSGGAAKGERLTCARTAKIFYVYCKKIKTVRESSFKTMWDERLKAEAIIQHQREMDEERRKKEESRKEDIEEDISGEFEADIINGYWGGTYGVDALPSTAAAEV
jgi:hypothetical protein